MDINEMNCSNELSLINPLDDLKFLIKRSLSKLQIINFFYTNYDRQWSTFEFNDFE